jgi:hypothetical protein
MQPSTTQHIDVGIHFYLTDDCVFLREVAQAIASQPDDAPNTNSSFGL